MTPKPEPEHPPDRLSRDEVRVHVAKVGVATRDDKDEFLFDMLAITHPTEQGQKN